jgi:protein-tyrosine-phosphatase
MECFNSYLKRSGIKGVLSDSAGIHTPMDGVSRITRENLRKKGIRFKYKPKKVNLPLIKGSDLIISMGENHRKFLKEKYDIDSVLFNKMAYGKNTSILDIEEKYPYLSYIPKKERMKQKNYKKRIGYVVSHICNGTPRLARAVIKLLEIK